SCMAGRCGTCRCKVLDGQGLEAGRGIKGSEQNEGAHVLVSMGVVTEDGAGEIAGPDCVVTRAGRLSKAQVVAVEEMTSASKCVRLKPSKPLEYSPGQYATLQFSPDHIRPYSMAGLAEDGELEFHVRVVPDGRVSGYVNSELKEGDAVRISGPLGTAYLRRK